MVTLVYWTHLHVLHESAIDTLVSLLMKLRVRLFLASCVESFCLLFEVEKSALGANALAPSVTTLNDNVTKVSTAVDDDARRDSLDCTKFHEGSISMSENEDIQSPSPDENMEYKLQTLETKLSQLLQSISRLHMTAEYEFDRGTDCDSGSSWSDRYTENDFEDSISHFSRNSPWSFASLSDTTEDTDQSGSVSSSNGAHISPGSNSAGVTH